ncbi:protein-disulfide reductase DsbD domain-containing protein [Bosea sp. BK604]|uniref:protein-disulfide reductase DsbD domain-containing protein n=1 Tax=Bosea sp. BK604 TaxID=2512180 RepID=UPI00105199CA|nr:protein-disulfide reductase DsbD domain-containing protein [Bosea sp. BK604]TCR61062.1 DsbC/DsbD-like thiol-disulfide interchange protein [Bosea sp. BK604]
MKPLLLLLALAAPALSAPVLAQDAAVSPWSKSSHSSLRLIAGATAPSGKQRVGVQITMSPGYKTYWRSPGDAGVPPVFDWSGSENVGGLDVRWPAPERFEDGNGYSIGYVGEVVVPVSVQPVDPQKPVTLVLALEYAVCEKICIPAKGEARLWLEPGVTSVSSPLLESYEARVPASVKLGQKRDKLAILEVKPEEEKGEAGLRILLRTPPEGTIEDVFVEGPGMWSFGKPGMTPQPDGSISAFVKINDRPKGASGPTPFIVTVRGKPAAVETRLELDIPVSKP